MNEVLRDEYIADCRRVLKSWNRSLEKLGTSFRVTLPSRRFHRRQGIYRDLHFSPQGEPMGAEEWNAREHEWLPSDADRAYVISLMQPVHELGKCANWIAAPSRGINGMPFEYEYVRR